jgi:hypothetical protein
MASASDRPRAALALALIGAIGALVAGSCTTALGLDSYSNAQSGLCDKLDECYASGAPPCQTWLSTKLVGIDVQGWLTQFSADTCLTSCAAARRCLDLGPVCAPMGQSCTQTEACCGFSTGQTDCVGGHCCLTRGEGCTSDADCCQNAGYCLPTTPDGGAPTCSGIYCFDRGVACQLDEQCCSGVCKGGSCASDICYDDGFDCTDAADCCSGLCDGTQRCGTECVPDDGACQTDADCCNQDCLDGICRTEACTPNDVSCVSDGDCCSQHCDPTYFKCSPTCVAAGGSCGGNAGACCSGACDQGACACSDGYCAVNGDCCSNVCVNRTCKPSCGAVDCGHTECIQGGPLKGMADANGPACSTCVTAVCAADAYCCCTAWDDRCVALAVTTPGCSCL